MNTTEPPEHRRALDRVWVVIPALWLVVGVAGFVALSHWPQLFA